jgi:hypothetical protein
LILIVGQHFKKGTIIDTNKLNNHFMKKLLNLLVPICLLGLTACVTNSTSNEKAITDSIIASDRARDSIKKVELMKLELAKKMTDQMLGYIEQCEMKKMSKKELDFLAKPLKIKQDSLRNTLTSEQIKELDEYFQKKANEMVDRLVQLKK